MGIGPLRAGGTPREAPAHPILPACETGIPDDTARQSAQKLLDERAARQSGKGFDVAIHDQLAVSGRIVCTEQKERQDIPANQVPAGME
jgi:hypothetical protein